MGSVVVNTSSFAEYAAAGRRRRGEIVTDQHQRLADPDNYAHVFYRPIVAAIRVAAGETDPEPLLRLATARAELNGQARAFEQIAAGFRRWWAGAKATAVEVGTTSLRVGELDVAVRPHLGLRTRTGELRAVLFYLKEPPLPRDAANAALRVLDLCMADLLPGATPLVVDLRRATERRLARNTNTTTLDAWISAEASAYTTHWRATA